MITTRNRTYSNLAIGFITLQVLNNVISPNPENMFVCGLHLLLAIFIYFQLELGRTKFNLAVIALYIHKLFFLQEAFLYFKNASFTTGITGNYGNEQNFTNASTGPSLYILGIIYVLPLLYLLFRMDDWLPKNTIQEKNTNSQKQLILNFIPLVTVAIILISNVWFGLKIGGTTGLLNIENGSAILPGNRNVSVPFSFDFSLIIIPIILTILFLMRKVYQFGFFVLSLFIIQILFVFVQHFYVSMTIGIKNQLFPEETPNGFIFISYVIPVLAVTLFLYYFFQLFQLNDLQYFNRFISTEEENAALNNGADVQADMRPEIKYDEFESDHLYLLKREAFPVFLCVILLGLGLIAIAFFSNETEYLPLFIGTGHLILGSLFYYGVIKTTNTLTQLGFYGILFLLIVPILLNFSGMPVTGFRTTGIAFTQLCLFGLVLVRGINVIKALNSPGNYVKFVVNRTNTRLFGRKLQHKFHQNDPEMEQLDKYSRSLIPWNIRKKFVFILFGIQGYLLITVLQLLGYLLGFADASMFYGLITFLCFTVFIVGYYQTIIRWQLLLNYNCCIVGISILAIQIASLTYNIMINNLSFETGLSIALVASQLIVYIIVIILLNERKASIGDRQIINETVLDN